jgi:hypothetical protein
MPDLVPAIFLGHRNPMNALLTNDYMKGWRRIGAQLPSPKRFSRSLRIGMCREPKKPTESAMYERLWLLCDSATSG